MMSGDSAMSTPVTATPEASWFTPWLIAAGANGQPWAVATGKVSSLRPPESVLPVAPVVFDGLLAVVGEYRAWAYDPVDGQWISLGEADRLLASTVRERVWRRVTLRDPGVLEAPFQWTEMGRNGKVFRPVQCNRPVRLGSPEPRGPLYDDLASTRIENLASRAGVANRCTWGDSLVVSTESELLACATIDGIELCDLAERTSVGFPFGSDLSEAGLAFVPNRYIAHE